MDENEQDEFVTQENDTEETVNDNIEDIDQEDELPEAIKKKIQTLEAQKNHWRKKAEKAGEKEEPGTQEKPVVKNDSLSSKDLIAIAKADIHEDDIDEVVEYAKFKNISVAEALKSSVVKTMLSESSEIRKSAEATNTSKVRKGSTKVSDEALLEKLSKGDIPEDKDSAERLFWARRGRSKE